MKKNCCSFDSFLLDSYQSMLNNNMTTMSTGSSTSNSSAGSTGPPMSLAAANVVRGIMEKVLSTPPMGSQLGSNARLFNEFDYLSSPGLDSDFGDTSPLLCAAATTTMTGSSSNSSHPYLRLPISSNKETICSSNFLSR